MLISRFRSVTSFKGIARLHALILVLLALLITFRLAGYCKEASDTDRDKEKVSLATRLSKQDPSNFSFFISQRSCEQLCAHDALDAVDRFVAAFYVARKTPYGMGIGPYGSGYGYMLGVGGIPASRIAVFIDGIPHQQALSGQYVPDFYLLTSLGYMEGILGPSPVLHGNGAMGSVLAISTPRRHFEGSSTRFTLSSGDLGNKANYIQHSGLYDSNRYSVTLGAVTGKGERDHSSFDAGDVRISYERSFGLNWSLGGSFRFMESIYSEPGSVHSPSKSQTDNSAHAASVELGWQSSKASITSTAYYSDNLVRASNGYVSAGNVLALRLKGEYFYGMDSKITCGADVKRCLAKASNSTTDTDFGKHIALESGVYSHVVHRFQPGLDLTAGVRLAYYEPTGALLAPQVGFACQASRRLVLKGGYARGFRFPSIRELYMYPGPNTDLLPEYLNGYRCGAELIIGKRSTLTFAGFYNKGEHLIETTGSFPDLVLKNSDDSEYWGIYTRLSYYPMERFFLNLDYCWRAPSVNVAYTPKHKLNGIASYALGRFEGAVSLRYAKQTYSDSDEQLPLEDYFLINLYLSGRITDYLRLWVKSENLPGSAHETMYSYPLHKAHNTVGLTFDL